MIKVNYIIEIDISRNYSQENFGVLWGDFMGLDVQMTPRRLAV